MSKKANRVTFQVKSPIYQSSLPEFLHEISVGCSDGDWVFRGQGQDGWPIPRIARGLVAKSNPAKLERRLLDEFSKKVPSVYSREITTDWEALALIQHYGGMTRLLDWTRNPLVAAWFALNAYLSTPKHARHSSGPVVWAVKVESEEWLNVRSSTESLEKLNSVRFISPPHFDGRISAQESIFSAHPLPKSLLDNIRTANCWTSNDVSKRPMFGLYLSAERAQEIYSMVQLCGYRADTIYPDIQGLCRHLAEQYDRAEHSPLIGTEATLSYSNTTKRK